VTPYREKVQACALKHTYKYFFEKDDVGAAWQRLEGAYGPARRNEAMKTLEINHAKFVIRATHLGNPITVFRKRRCTEDDVEELHRVIGFAASHEAPGDGA
jgi:hypothetical protein